jgi:hypothetical protein
MSKLTLKTGDYTIEAVQEDGPFSTVQVTVYDDYLQKIVPPELYDVRAAQIVGTSLGYTIAETVEDFRRLFSSVEQLVSVDKTLGV